MVIKPAHIVRQMYILDVFSEYIKPLFYGFGRIVGMSHIQTYGNIAFLHTMHQLEQRRAVYVLTVFNPNA